MLCLDYFPNTQLLLLFFFYIHTQHSKDNTGLDRSSDILRVHKKAGDLKPVI